MSAEELKSGAPPDFALAGLLYRLTVAFPSWAGALLALYALKMRFR